MSSNMNELGYFKSKSFLIRNDALYCLEIKDNIDVYIYQKTGLNK